MNITPEHMEVLARINNKTDLGDLKALIGELYNHGLVHPAQAPYEWGITTEGMKVWQRGAEPPLPWQWDHEKQCYCHPNGAMRGFGSLSTRDVERNIQQLRDEIALWEWHGRKVAIAERKDQLMHADFLWDRTMRSLTTADVVRGLPPRHGHLRRDV